MPCRVVAVDGLLVGQGTQNVPVKVDVPFLAPAAEPHARPARPVVFEPCRHGPYAAGGVAVLALVIVMTVVQRRRSRGMAAEAAVAADLTIAA